MNKFFLVGVGVILVVFGVVFYFIGISVYENVSVVVNEIN